VMWTFMIPITFSACHSQEINAFRWIQAKIFGGFHYILNIHNYHLSFTNQLLWP
jgi:hypothetical protein